MTVSIGRDALHQPARDIQIFEAHDASAELEFQPLGRLHVLIEPVLVHSGVVRAEREQLAWKPLDHRAVVHCHGLPVRVQVYGILCIRHGATAGLEHCVLLRRQLANTNIAKEVDKGKF